MTLTLNPNLDFLNPKSIGFDDVQDYHCAKFQVILIMGFCFIMHPTRYAATHTHIHTMTNSSQYRRRCIT